MLDLNKGMLKYFNREYLPSIWMEFLHSLIIVILLKLEILGLVIYVTLRLITDIILEKYTNIKVLPHILRLVYLLIGFIFWRIIIRW
jgi:hypothetical protein